MNTIGMLRTITQSQEYTKQAEAFKGSPRFFDIEAAIDWGIATNPTVWPIVEGTTSLRVLRTTASGFNGNGIDGEAFLFRVAFKIVDDNNAELLAIDKIPAPAGDVC